MMYPQKVGRGTTCRRSSRLDCGPSRSSSSCWPLAARAHPRVSLCNSTRFFVKPCGGPVLADPAQMHQVMMHLGANAADAMRQTGGRLEVSLDTVHVLAEAGDPPYLSPGAYVCIRVRDTGCGMSPEV